MKSIIWNLTRQCAWNCSFCCVDAKYVGPYKLNPDCSHDYHPADELSFNQKIKIIDNIDIPVRIDFSGGELLLDSMNTELIIYASKKFGKKNIGVSTSGIFIDENWIKKVSGYINEVELTIDKIPFTIYKHRPIGYHEYAANAVKLLKKNNIYTGVQTVLNKDNSDIASLKLLYQWLIKQKVDSWSILKFFPTGRGNKFSNLKLTESEYLYIIKQIKAFKTTLEIHFQYVFSENSQEKKCRAVKKSLGILPSGDCITCFWALQNDTKPKNNKFVMGNLLETKLSTLLQSDVAKYWETITECVLF